MSIRFGNWFNPKTNKQLAAVRVTYYLDRDDLANVLAAAVKPGGDELTDVSPATAEKAIREWLHRQADSAAYWSDDYRDEEESYEKVKTWALTQVDRMLGT